MLRLFLFLIGFWLTVIGSMYIISYLNLLAFGYKFIDYVNFITRRIECINALIGIVLILLVLIIPGGKKDELCL